MAARARWVFLAAGAVALDLTSLSRGSAFGREPQAPPAAPPPVSLGVAGAENAHVSIAVLRDRVVVAWGATRPGSSTDIYAAFSRDGGATFGPPVRVNDVDGDARVSGEQAPRVAMTSDRVQVVWMTRQEGRSVVRSATARAGSPVFAPATTVHPDKLTGARGWASLAIGLDASHVVWLDGRGDGSAAPRAAEGEGRVRVRKAMRQDLYQAAWRTDGTHDETRIATDVCFCCKTSVAAYGRDVYVAWRHIYKPNLRDVAVAHSSDGGRTFGSPVRVSEDGWAIDGCPDDGPSLVAQQDHIVHVAWPTLVSDSKGIFYSRSLDHGRSFSPRVRLDDEAGNAAHPQMALGGLAYVVWEQARGDGTSAVVVRSIPVGTGQLNEKPRMTAPSRLGVDASYPAVAATTEGAIVAWTEQAPSGSEIRVQRVR